MPSLEYVPEKQFQREKTESDLKKVQTEIDEIRKNRNGKIGMELITMLILDI